MSKIIFYELFLRNLVKFNLVSCKVKVITDRHAPKLNFPYDF